MTGVSILAAAAVTQMFGESAESTLLAANRATWEGAEIESYTYKLVTMSVWDLNPSRYTVVVEDGQPVEGRSARQPWPAATIDETFDFLADNVDAEVFEVEYDDLGYPTRIEIDHAERADDEVTISIIDFEVTG